MEWPGSRLIAALLGRRHVRRLGGLVLTSGWGQFLLGVLGLVVARNVGPTTLGVYGFLAAFAGYLALASSLRLDQAAMFARSLKVARRIIALGSPITLSTLTLGVVLAYGAGWIDTWVQAVGVWILAVVIQISLYALGLAVRQDHMGSLAKRNIRQPTSIGLSQWVASVTFPSSVILLMAETLGRLVGLWCLRASVRVPGVRFTRSRFAWLSRQVRPYVAISFPTTVLDAIAFLLPIALAGVLFGPVEAGFAALCLRLIGLLGTAIGGSLSAVLVGRLSAYSSTEVSSSVRSISGRIRLRIALLSIAVGLAVAGLSWPITHFLGAGWEGLAIPLMLSGAAVATTVAFRASASASMRIGELSPLLWVSILRLSGVVIVGILSPSFFNGQAFLILVVLVYAVADLVGTLVIQRNIHR